MLVPLFYIYYFFDQTYHTGEDYKKKTALFACANEGFALSTEEHTHSLRRGHFAILFRLAS